MLVHQVFSLRFAISETESWAKRYSYGREEEEAQSAADNAMHRGFMTKSEFLAIVHWKSPRRIGWAAENSEDDIKDATRSAFSTTNGRVRIGVLTTLHGVGYPTASAILHLACKDVPILDVNALSAFSIRQPSLYNYSFWNDYCRAVSEIAEMRSTLSLRTIDKALWAFGKENPLL